MRNQRHSICLAAVAWLTFAVHLCHAMETGEDREFVTIFDGKTLSGWSGDPRLWKAASGVIVGRTTDEMPLDQNEFLIWDEEVEDFVLRLQFRVADHGVGNSGIQYRSRRSPEVGKWVVAGYQADIDRTNKYMGILYEERGRGILAEVGEKVVIESTKGKKRFHRRNVGSSGEAAAILQNVHAGEWINYEVSAIGNHLVHKVNDRVTVDVLDSDAERAAGSGVLALQLHKGPSMQIEFRCIRIRRVRAE